MVAGMIFAPAIGIASFQVLGGLCWFVAVLAAVGIFRQYIAPIDTLDAGQLLIIGPIFGIAGFLCFWAARMIRRKISGT
jgi:hypothetical protein